MFSFLTPAHAGVFMALAAVAGWSANFLFSRMLSNQVPPFTLILLRCLVAFIVFAPFTYKGFVRSWPLIRARIGFYLFLSLTGLGYYNALVYIAGRSTSVINMSLLATTSPIFILLLSKILLGEPLTGRRVFGILTAVTGVILLTTKGDINLLLNFSFHAGDILMIAASFMFACYTVGMRRITPDLDNNSLLLATFIFSAVFLLPVSGWELASGQALHVTPESVTGVLYLGVVASIFSYWCWTNAIARIGPGNTALIYYTMPLFSGLEAVLVLNEPLLWVHFASGALILLGVLTATRK